MSDRRPAAFSNLSEGDQTIARQFTAGIQMRRTQVPKGRLMLVHLPWLFLFVWLKEYDIEPPEQTAWE